MNGPPLQSAPLFEALQALAARDPARFHMPGHKGRPVFQTFADVFQIDFTETYGTGNLYEGTGPIRAAEKQAAAYYGASDCHFLTGGSTQGVQAMLCASCAPEGAVVLDRAAHKSAAAACALFGLAPSFVYPAAAEPFGFPGLLDPAEVEDALRRAPDARALLVVSPNYYGVQQDIPALAALAHRYGKRLLVDAAHGAHLPALGFPSPVQQGADAAVLSAHKTLPCLGQGAYLLLGEGADGARLREAEAMVGTSSPSYPVLASLDLTRAWLEGAGKTAYRTAAALTARLRASLSDRTPFTALTGRDFAALDPCRLTVYCGGAGVTGHALADALYEKHDVACEMADARNVVFIVTGADNAAGLARLCRALVHEGKHLTPGEAPPPTPGAPRADRACTVRRAWFAPRETVPLSRAAGRVCARGVTPYPPGVPLLWPGEKITPAHIEFLTQRCYTKHTEIDVVSGDI